MQFRDILNKALQIAGNQENLATKLDLSPSALSKKLKGETGWNETDIDNLFDIADFHKWTAKGIAIYMREATAVDYIQRALIGGKVGETDTTKYQYIALYTTDYDSFKHEVYHVFQNGHSLIGSMFAIRTIAGIPITSSNLSESSKREIIKNKWRSYENNNCKDTNGIG